jgi:hypothetical protein
VHGLYVHHIRLGLWLEVCAVYVCLGPLLLKFAVILRTSGVLAWWLCSVIGLQTRQYIIVRHLAVQTKHSVFKPVLQYLVLPTL